MTLVLLTTALVLAIRLPVVQTWVAQRAASWLTDELHTNVTLDEIRIDFFRTVTINGLYVEDKHGDTLIYAGELNTIIGLFEPMRNKIYLTDVILNDAVVKLQKYPNEKGLNFNFIVDYFSTGSSDTTPSKPFDFNPGEVKLNNVVFVYRDNRYNDYFRGVDFEDIRLLGLNADIDDVRFDGDSVYARVDHIEFTEKSGFSVEYFEADAKITPASMEFDDLLIKTEETQLVGKIAFNFDSYDDFDDFIAKVRITSEFDESVLSSNDLVYFATELEGLDQQVTFSGKIRGTIDQLRGRNLNIAFADHSHFKGDISIAGLPDFEESFFDLVVDELVTDRQDIASIPSYPFTENNYIVLPAELDRLGKVSFSGKFTGFLNDFVAYGNAHSALGFVSSDINLKIDNEAHKNSYSGHLSVIGFDIGTLTGNSELLGKTTFKAKVSGSGFTLAQVNARMDGVISALDLNGYTYRNIMVDGEMSRKLFSGKLTVDEENLGLSFNGTIDLKHGIPLYDFTTEITNARLARLNLIDRDSSALLNTKAVISMKGRDIDQMTGYIRIGETRYSELGSEMILDSLSFISYTENGMKKASLRSTLIDMDMNGSYNRSTMYAHIRNLVAEYIPALQHSLNPLNDQMDFEYAITFKKTNKLLDIFYPMLQMSEGTTLKGNLNSGSGTINLVLLSDSIRFSEAKFKGVRLDAVSNGNALNFTNNVADLTLRDTLKLVNFSLSGQTDTDKSIFTIAAAARDSNRTNFKVNCLADYQPSGQVLLQFLPSYMLVEGNHWEFDKNNSTLIDSTFIDINTLTLVSGNQKVSLNGVASAQSGEYVNIHLENFDTRIINPVLAMYGVDITGIATGSGEIASIFAKPGITSKMTISNFGVYGDTLGDGFFDFSFNTEKNFITVEAIVDRGGIKNIEVEGKYIIRPVNDFLDFNITFHKTNLAAFGGYAKDLVSDLRGKASGNLHLTGTVKQPQLLGKIRLQQTSFLVDYLNTRYNFSEEVEFTQKYFRFKNFTVNDDKGNQANVDGYIYHRNLKDFVLSFDIVAKNFQMLNTGLSDNELYYGEAYGSGNVRITGPLDMINMNLAIRTEKNTRIFIPLSNPEEISKYTYINFITAGQLYTDTIKKTIDFSGISMNFELDVTPDAEVQLIFDSKIGDIIKGRGEGNIIMTINTQGDFRIFGNYQVSSGDYLFTLQNLINKKFTITPGGTITWSGSPYNADINLEGVYKLRTSLYDLFQDTSYKKRVPVEVELQLQDDLFNPTISFDITVPDIDPTAETLIRRYISTEQEKSRQTMSLLVLNRFSPGENVAYLGTSSSGVSANATEFLSQQLSNWASQISDAVAVGVNYRAADAFSQEELEVALSTQLFNDRISVDGNVGLTDNNNRNTSSLVGDFNVEVKVSEDGKLRFKAFNKTINNSLLNNYNSPYTQGIGIFYREEFDSVGELLRRFRDKFRRQDTPADAMNRPTP